MNFLINGEKIDVSLENEKTVGDVLSSFEVMCEQNHAAVIGISIDGRQVTAESFDEESEKPVSAEMKFEFNVVTKDHLKESFTHLSKLFVELSQRMQQIPVDLQCGKIRESNTAIKNVADGIQEFCHIATLSALFPEYTITKIDEKPFSEFFSEFTPVLADFEEALKSNDTVTVGDLSEYEICPRLEAIAKALEELSCQ